MEKLEKDFELFEPLFFFFAVFLKRQNYPLLKLQFYHGKILILIINVSVQVLLYKLNCIQSREGQFYYLEMAHFELIYQLERHICYLEHHCVV